MKSWSCLYYNGWGKWWGIYEGGKGRSRVASALQTRWEYFANALGVIHKHTKNRACVFYHFYNLLLEKWREYSYNKIFGIKY
ncbi:hypothetical protein B7O87_09605 [Cylindrospermopsis raciborskii CENA303]|uniref:Uncharacterized protein n=1 Tax=Cylindrospermopsis raciborskii CENA303 TaxID=1170769 RepID=A0A1X4G6C4_9CYAN|nr:hypothetical protein B7O87_09605 [Cylindrospermopsis raciborskii CENA303]